MFPIQDLKDQPTAEIHVFNHYGKPLKAIPPTQVWDRSFYGQEMSSFDYRLRAVLEYEVVRREHKFIPA